MLQHDLSLLVLCYLQPPFFGFLLFMLARQGLLNKVLFTHYRASRKRHKNVRFFECAVYARLLGALRYDLQALSFTVVFILYDVDLLFLYSEVLFVESWGLPQAALFIIYGGFFIAGLAYDIGRQGLAWAQ